MANVRLTRRVGFSSGHRYWLEAESEARNAELFGRWASRFNHGHNYFLEVTAIGPVDESTGMVVNIKDIDAVLQELVVERFDQKSINDEVPEFAGLVPSTENLLRFFVAQLSELPGEVELIELKLEETPTLHGNWKKDNDKVTITRSYEFAASHRLYIPEMSEERNLELYGKCCNEHGHGHNYILEVEVSGEPDSITGFVTDLTQLDEAVEELVVDRYDHKNLNIQVEELAGKVPTSEVVALAIFSKLDGSIPGVLESVRLHETARNIFEVKRNDL